VTDNDIETARVFLRQNETLIQARLTPSAVSRWRAVLKRHGDQRLALILDGRLISAAVIKSPLNDAKPSSNRYLNIHVQLADTTVKRLKALITARWPADSK